METKTIIGLTILVLNVSGLGFLFYMGGLRLLDHLFNKGNPQNEDTPLHAKSLEKASAQGGSQGDLQEDMPHDDLLKDMDLSDLDNLNLDDFE